MGDFLRKMSGEERNYRQFLSNYTIKYYFSKWNLLVTVKLYYKT